MVQERLNAAGELTQNQGDLQREGIKLMRHIMRTHKITDPGPKEQQVRTGRKPQESKPEIPQTPEVILAGQVDRLVDLGFWAEVYPNLPEDEAKTKYRADFTLPESGAVQPEAYKGRFDVLLVIDPRVELIRQHARSKPKINEYIDTGKITNETPVGNKPYIAWTHDANRYRQYSVDQAIAQFSDDEVGSPQVEVTSLYLHHPEFFKDHGVNASGSRSEYGFVPCLYAFGGGPEVDADSSGGRGQDWGALSRGNKIIVLGS